MDAKPYPPEWNVDRALSAYLDENGFTREEYDAPRTPASFLGVRFTVPNTPAHRVAIRLHDLHHVATGFGTDLVGEGEVSAFEARGGLREVGVYTGALVTSGVLVGLAAAPLRVRWAWRGGRAGNVLWSKPVAYERLLEMSVRELRALLGVPSEGLARAPRKLHAYAPKPASAS